MEKLNWKGGDSTEKMKRGRERGNRRQLKTKTGRMSKEIEWVVEMCPMESLIWTITAWSTAYAAGRHWIESESWCYRSGFHTADSVLINTLMFFIQHILTDWKINTFDPENISLFITVMLYVHRDQNLLLLSIDWCWFGQVERKAPD